MSDDREAFCQDNLNDRNLLATARNTDNNPLTIAEFRKGIAEIVAALKNVSGAKFFHRVEVDGSVTSFGAETLEELRQMTGEPYEGIEEPLIRKASE